SALIRNDFAKTEDYLAKLVQLYNDHQTMSVDSYYPRDLALHCVIRCQHNNISDVPNLKYRHPTITVAMPHFVSDQEMQRAIREKANAIVSKERVEVDGFMHLTSSEVVQLGLFSQSQYMYATQILCGYLFPTPAQALPQSHCFAKLLEYKACGKISQDILESLSVAAGERLAQFLNRLSIDWYSLPENLQAPCASPVALDTFYRLTLVLPSTCEPIVNDILQRLNIMDAQVAKAAAVAANIPAGHLSANTAGAAQPGAESDLANNAPQVLKELWDTKTLWLQTVVQLVAYRLMRYLRDSHHAPTLLNCVVHLLQQAPCRQLYQSLETLVMQILNVQSDQRLFEALLGYRSNPKDTTGGQTNPPQSSRPRPTWFADNEMLARRLVMTLAHLVKTCDMGRRLSQETVHTVLGNCGSGPRLVWSTTTLAYFPPVIRDYYLQAYATVPATETTDDANDAPALASTDNGGDTVAAALLPTISTTAAPSAMSTDPKARATTPIGLSTSPTVAQVNHIISQDDIHNILILGEADQRNEQALLDFYACEANQQLFLCVLWTIVEIQNEVHPFMMRYVRRILRSFPANHLTSYTVALVDFVLDKPLDDAASDQGYLHHGRLLDDFIWKYQILNLDHVVFALCRGHRTLTAESSTHRILQYLLFDSEALQARLTHWRSLGFSTQPWTDVDHFSRLCQYLERFPEFHDYEAFQAQSYADLTTMPTLDPPHASPLPVFYETQILRLIHGLDFLVARCLEQEDKALLCRLLTTYGDLIKTHYQFPLRFVQNTLHYYYDSALLRDRQVLRALFSVLDWDQYAFTPEFQSLVTSDALNIFELLSAEYITKLLEHTVHLTQPMSVAPHSSPCPIARQYREYSNPWMFGVHHLAIEIMVLSLLLEEQTGTAQLAELQEKHVAYGHNLVLISLMNLVGQPWLLQLSRIAVPATHPLQLLAATFALLPVQAFSRPAVIHVLHCIKTEDGAPLAEVTPAYLQSWFETVGTPPIGSSMAATDGLPSAAAHAAATSGGGGSDVPTADAVNFPALSPMQSYIFNPYVTNYEHFTNNIPNCYLAFFQSLVKYSGIDIFYTVHAMLRSLRSPATLSLVATTNTTPLDELLPGVGDNLALNNGSGSAASATGGASAGGGPMSARSNEPTTPAGLAAAPLTMGGGATPATPTPGFPVTPGRAMHPPAASPAPLLAFNQPTPLGQPLALLTSTPTPLRAASSLSLGEAASGATTASGGKNSRQPNHHPGLMGTRDLTADFAIVDAIHQRLVSSTGSSLGALSSDAQLLYLMALIGPTLYRLDSNSPSGYNHGHKIEDGLLLRALVADLLWLLVEISATLPLYGHHSTLGVETIVDFFHHVRASFAHDGQAHALSLSAGTCSAATFWRDLEPIVQQLKEPLRCRLLALCFDRKG
ncbi:hypothetical protein H4R35_004567, partial [Dimargaris xerosporica]